MGSLNWLPGVLGKLKSEYLSDELPEFLVNSKKAAKPITTIPSIPMTNVPTPPTALVIDSRKPSAGFAFTTISMVAVLLSPSSSVAVMVISHVPGGKSLMTHSAP